jgi:hypothetical protein
MRSRRAGHRASREQPHRENELARSDAVHGDVLPDHFCDLGVDLHAAVPAVLGVLPAPGVWRGDELADTDCWIIRFTEEDFADFERALAHAAQRQPKDITETRAEDFPLPRFRERIGDIVDRLEHGLRPVQRGRDPAHQRQLLRLWISRPETGRPLCPEYAVWRSGYPR